MMSHFCSLNATIHTPPTHNSSFRSQSTFQYFIPTNHFLSLGLKHLLNTLSKPALQLVHTSDIFAFHEGLALRTGFPETFITLIAADMNVLTRKQIGHFGKYFIKDLKYHFFSGAK